MGAFSSLNNLHIHTFINTSYPYINMQKVRSTMKEEIRATMRGFPARQPGGGSVRAITNRDVQRAQRKRKLGIKSPNPFGNERGEMEPVEVKNIFKGMLAESPELMGGETPEKSGNEGEVIALFKENEEKTPEGEAAEGEKAARARVTKGRVARAIAKALAIGCIIGAALTAEPPKVDMNERGKPLREAAASLVGAGSAEETEAETQAEAKDAPGKRKQLSPKAQKAADELIRELRSQILMQKAMEELGKTPQEGGN